MKNLFEEDDILTHRFFRAVYWRTFSEKSEKPQVGFYSFLGTLKSLICNKGGFGVEGFNIGCSLDYDDDDNKLTDKAFFAFYPDDWDTRSEETSFVNHSDFIKLVEEVLIQYESLQEKRWKKCPHIREAEEQEIQRIKECLDTNFRQNQ
jgi:hypothetical protein